MSALPVTLLACEREDSLALLTVVLPDGQQLSALSTTAVATEPGTPLLARVKAAEIALARPPLGAISLRNRIASRVTAIEAGRLLARVRLEKRMSFSRRSRPKTSSGRSPRALQRSTWKASVSLRVFESSTH